VPIKDMFSVPTASGHH